MFYDKQGRARSANGFDQGRTQVMGPSQGPQNFFKKTLWFFKNLDIFYISLRNLKNLR